MSLNGLDDPKVREAHAAAIAEPGGWYVELPCGELGLLPRCFSPCLVYTLPLRSGSRPLDVFFVVAAAVPLTVFGAPTSLRVDID